MWRVQLSHFSAGMLAVQVSWSCFLLLNLLNSRPSSFLSSLVPMHELPLIGKASTKTGQINSDRMLSIWLQLSSTSPGVWSGIGLLVDPKGEPRQGLSGDLETGRTSHQRQIWQELGFLVSKWEQNPSDPLNRIPGKETAFSSRPSQWLSPRFGKNSWLLIHY